MKPHAQLTQSLLVARQAAKVFAEQRDLEREKIRELFGKIDALTEFVYAFAKCAVCGSDFGPFPCCQIPKPEARDAYNSVWSEAMEDARRVLTELDAR